MSKHFWTLEILYDYRGELKRFEHINVSEGEQTRDIINAAKANGITVPLSKDCFIVIFPGSIKDITLYRQDKFFEHLHSDLKKTVYDNNKKKI